MQYKLIELDPRALMEFPGNVRQDLGDLDGMVETMRELGVLQPIIVHAQGEHYEILAGRRRTAAAILADLPVVPALLADGASDDTTDTVRSLIENLVRKDLTATEEAVGWRQLAIAGLDDATISRMVGVPSDRVVRGRAVADSQVAMAVSRKHDLTLEQAFVLAEFDDDTDAVKKLTVTAVKDPGQFAHVASRLRMDRANAAEIVRLTAKAEKDGVAVTTAQVGWNMAGPRYLDDLKAKDGKTLTVTNHKKCPGHACRISMGNSGKVVTRYVCLQPAGNGHKDKWGGSTDSGTPKAAPGSKEAEKAKAERRKVLDGNKAWRAAEPVRREFVVSLLARKAAPKEVMPFIAAEMLLDPRNLTSMHSRDAMLTELAGAKPDALLAKATPPRMPLAALAHVAAARETEMGVETWRRKWGHEQRWLRFLVAVGYQASDVERGVIGK